MWKGSGIRSQARVAAATGSLPGAVGSREREILLVEMKGCMLRERARRVLTFSARSAGGRDSKKEGHPRSRMRTPQSSADAQSRHRQRCGLRSYFGGPLLGSREWQRGETARSNRRLRYVASAPERGEKAIGLRVCRISYVMLGQPRMHSS
ncbi:hypothetical protein L1887_51461 [Cichorium endivia]|nr:hypothetical protein L1887_51461 [Cichorium endivia]